MSSVYGRGVQIVNKLEELWVEKYRPSKPDELIASPEVKNFVTSCIKKQSIPNLLLYGRPGTGKNSIVNILLTNIDCVKLIINASEERGIDTIREKVLGFSTTAAWGSKPKIVVLNEADGLAPAAQDSLREIMENVSNNCRYILTCNSISRVNDAIRSRCVEFELKPRPKDIVKRLVEILREEGVDFTKDYIVYIVKKYNTDIRKIINETQKIYNIYGELKIVDVENNNDSYFELLLDKNKSVKEIANVVKKLVLSDDIYSELKNYVINNYDSPEAIIAIAEHAYKDRFVVDKDLVLMSCIFTLREIL
jgi:DNA polymerase III delta prime subunit